MKKFRLKYFIFCCLLPVTFCAKSQTDNNAENNGATVTIIGSLGNDNSNISQTNNINSPLNAPPPPEQQQLAPTEQNVEPSLENGFHMRYQVESPGSVERMSSLGTSVTNTSSSSTSTASGGTKAKRHTATIAERSFNFKKKFRNWFPKRKKKYHPTLCEKFK